MDQLLFCVLATHSVEVRKLIASLSRAHYQVVLQIRHQHYPHWGHWIDCAGCVSDLRNPQIASTCSWTANRLVLDGATFSKEGTDRFELIGFACRLRRFNNALRCEHCNVEIQFHSGLWFDRSRELWYWPLTHRQLLEVCQWFGVEPTQPYDLVALSPSELRIEQVTLRAHCGWYGLWGPGSRNDSALLMDLSANARKRWDHEHVVVCSTALRAAAF